MLEKYCNGNLISTFPPCYAFQMIFTVFAPRLIQSKSRNVHNKIRALKQLCILKTLQNCDMHHQIFVLAKQINLCFWPQIQIPNSPIVCIIVFIKKTFWSKCTHCRAPVLSWFICCRVSAVVQQLHYTETPFNVHGAVRGSGQGLFPPRWFLRLHQPPGDNLTWPLSPTNTSWSGESTAAPAAGTSWPRLAPQSLERSWRPLTLDSARWNVLYPISYVN